MDVLLLHNENAGDEDWSRRELERLVRRAGHRPIYWGLDDALKKSRGLDRADFVAVAGGDGSVRKVALELMGRNVPLAPVPIGTANNIARSMGLDGKPEEIIAGWARPRRRRFDLGVARGPWGKKYFVEGVGLGLVSRTIAVLTEIDEASAHRLDDAKDRLHRDACVAAALAHEMGAIRVKVRMDGRKTTDDFLLVEVLNIRRAGPAIEFAPKANPSDGRFDVVTVTAKQRHRLVAHVLAGLVRAKKIPRLPIQRRREVKFVARDIALRIDDSTEQIDGRATVSIHVAKHPLEFLLPGK